jgi:FAD/FMN-containing dehydrogenase
MEKRAALPGEVLEVHPATEAELQSLLASTPAGACVRVRGAFHSELSSVRPDRGAPQLLIVLDKMVKVGNVDRKSGLVAIEAGASLGGDPQADGDQSDPAKSICHRLHAQGYALPITGGITHQTISGFMGTGADGGSLRHSFWSAVEKFTLIDGTGRLHTFRRGKPGFATAAVSMGLLGVITKVWLRPERRYEVFGMSSVQRETGGDFDLFGEPGSCQQSLIEFLQRKPYARALWWPQPGVERVELWEAERFDAKLHGPIIAGRQVGPRVSGLAHPALQIVIRALFSLLADLRDPGKAVDARAALEGVAQGDPTGLLGRVGEIHSQLKPRTIQRFGWQDFATVRDQVLAALTQEPPEGTLQPPTQGPVPELTSAYAASTDAQHDLELLVAGIINQFIRLSPTSKAAWPSKSVDGPRDGFTRHHCYELFKDDWHTGLPMDNPIDDDVLPVTFTELWVPLERGSEALRALRALFREQRLAATGTFCVELYAAMHSPAALSMASAGPVLRIDPFYCDNGDIEARNAFFERFWSTLAPFDARPHWGKALPPADPKRMQALYSRLGTFLTLRKKLDPKGLFLSNYWRAQLGAR